jgi:hypothetical protein
VGSRDSLFDHQLDVRFWHKADMPIALLNVRFRGQSGHRAKALQCPLMTHLRHQRLKIAAVQVDPYNSIPPVISLL